MYLKYNIFVWARLFKVQAYITTCVQHGWNYLPSENKNVRSPILKVCNYFIITK